MDIPATGEFNLALAPFDPRITETDLRTPNSAEDNLTSAQSAQTSNSQPHVPCAPSSSKRKRSKPTRLEVSQSDVQKEHPRPISVVLSEPAGPSSSSQKEKPPTKGFKTPVSSAPAMIRAVEVQYSLGTEFPTCIKMMYRSQVHTGFWLGLPLQFCKTYLPKEDSTLVLEDENGEHIEVKYIAYKFGISAGWKNFAHRHNLVEEDVLVFQLVETTRFKVFILKANDSSEAGHSLSLLNSEEHMEQTTPVTPSPKTKSVGSSRSAPHRRTNDSEEGGLEVPECSGSSKPYLSFQEVKSFQDFNIMVKGLCIDRELPNDVRTGYYKLCCLKNEFLHYDLPEGLYYKLVASMIGETVSIANEIKNCKLTTTKEAFATWDNCLKSFELLGMKVGFLRYKIQTLAQLVFESEGALDIKQYVEAKTEHERAQDEIDKVATKLEELKEKAKKFEGVAGCLKQKFEQYEQKFQEEVDALR